MILEFLSAAAAISDLQSAPAAAPSATEIANSTKFELEFSGHHVAGCTVTATSGYARVDRYICDAARQCGDQFRTVDKRAACLAKKREELIQLLTKHSERG